MKRNNLSKHKPIKSGFTISRKVFGYPYIIFMFFFVVLPLVMILVNAFMDTEGKFTLENFAEFFRESQNMTIFVQSLVIGFITTLICLIIGYPVAYLVNKYHKNSSLILFFVLPMWVNFLVRTLSLQSIFKFLHIELGMGTLITGLVYMFLPYMILPLNTTLSGIDKSYIEAAQDLGADNMTVLIKTIFPLSLPGIISGITMVFIPTISTFAISGFLSGSATIQLFGDSINSKFTYQLYGIGSVMSLVMLVMVLLSNFVMNKFSSDNSAEVKNVW